MWSLFLDAAFKVGLPLLATLGLVMVFRRVKLPHGFQEGTNDIEGIYLAVVAAIYAVILAFMVFVVWTKYDAASNTVDQEASALMDVQRIAQALPDPYPAQFREHCRAYAVAVVDHDWPNMAKKERTRDSAGRDALDLVWKDLFALQHDARIDTVSRDHLYDRLLVINDARRSRLRTARTDLPAVLWTLLYFGGGLTVFVAAVFSVEKIGLHLFKAVALTLLIFMALFVVQALDHPFRGFARLDASAFRTPSRQQTSAPAGDAPAHTEHGGRTMPPPSVPQ